MSLRNQAQDSGSITERTIQALAADGDGTVREEAEHVSIVSEGGDVWATTRETYRPPVRIRLRARTNWKDIRIRYGDGQVFFNWQGAFDTASIRELLTKEVHHLRGGALSVDQWHDIVWEIGTDAARVVADGQLFLSQEGDFSSLSSAVSIGTIEATTVDVASLVIEPFTDPVPAVRRPCRVREPIRGNTVLLEGLGPNRQFYGGGAVVAALRYFGSAVDEAWVFGGCGMAFVPVTLPSEGICASATNNKPWGCGDAWKHLPNNVGCKVTAEWAGADTYEKDRPRLWRVIREAIDAGFPVTVFDIGASCEDTMVCGYDDAGNYLYLDADGGIHKHPWNRLGRVMMRGFGTMIYEPCDPAPDRSVVRDALGFALDSATGKYCGKARISGADAYNAWIAVVEDADRLRGSAEDCSVHAECWSECRRRALGFLEEAKARLADRQLDPLFDEAIRHYAEVSDNLSDIRQLFSFQSAESAERRIAEPERRDRAVQALTAARDAEPKGLKALQRIVAAL